MQHKGDKENMKKNETRKSRGRRRHREEEEEGDKESMR